MREVDGVTDKTAELLAELMKLPPEARAAVAGKLLDSLDETVDPDAEAAWEIEINKRFAELESGKIEAIPWSQARQQVFGD